MKKIKKTFQYGEHKVSLETGALARHANGAVLVSVGDTRVLVTAVGKKTVDLSKDFFPLTVNYQERYYANGTFPGGFIKRESRPSIKETLISRLIDRPLRPSFPKGFFNEVQIIATLMSLDPEIPSDIPAIIGAAAALEISDIPFNGPLAAARVGYIDGSYILNPTNTQMQNSELDLVVASSSDAILMVESEAKELPEDVMLGAVMFGKKEIQTAITAIKEFAKEVNKEKFDWQPVVENSELIEKINNFAKSNLTSAYSTSDDEERKNNLANIHKDTLEKYVDEDNKITTKQVNNILSEIEKEIVRNKILDQGIRIDGRDTKTVRPINIDLSVLPRAHGSAIFTRGGTQAFVSITLGTGNDAQIIDTPSLKTTERFMLHYNFPPFCIGEIRMMTGPKRRELGHGTLAKRALLAVLPNSEDFPYVIRSVSEITESNGSSSMATVCGTSLALMDAGVPLTSPVAGVAMGLIKKGDKFVILTDILGIEDHMGDMDFKVAGTIKGITALQMDIKINGITEEILDEALKQAKEGRQHIFDIMQEKISKSRNNVSEYAPRIITMSVKQEKIREIIGKGGVTIRSIIEETGAKIDIQDDGSITISSIDKEAGESARAKIECLTAEPEVGKVYPGKVMKITEFGAFVNIMPNIDGLVHISQISSDHVKNVSDYIQEGQVIDVKILEIDRQGKIRLTMKELD